MLMAAKLGDRDLERQSKIDFLSCLKLSPAYVYKMHYHTT